MLTLGNTKLGKAFWTFSIPAVLTCIGATALCLSKCYARKGRSLTRDVKNQRARNLERTKADSFVTEMKTLIRDNYVRLLRLHVEGDFYSAEYVRKWVAIAEASPDTTILAYTRSWQHPDLVEALMEFGSLPNVRLWLSCDGDTRQPPNGDWVYGRAYMSVSDGDLPDYPVDLVFRDSTKTVMKYTPRGDFVCPYEQGVKGKEKITCSRCRYCVSGETKRRPAVKGRVALAVL